MDEIKKAAVDNRVRRLSVVESLPPSTAKIFLVYPSVSAIPKIRGMI